ncbi:hypothetical protein [Streptomyces sp. NBC_01643]|uniref:hypothetical protein n=1 Tax=Streptomyces sp. NBC_01643 TaxID=2975906 RepID=UPI002F90A1FF|nr:hypothetical protein OHB03_47165 [Streptomyces sp. NBC_01643]
MSTPPSQRPALPLRGAAWASGSLAFVGAFIGLVLLETPLEPLREEVGQVKAQLLTLACLMVLLSAVLRIPVALRRRDRIGTGWATHIGIQAYYVAIGVVVAATPGIGEDGSPTTPLVALAVLPSATAAACGAYFPPERRSTSDRDASGRPGLATRLLWTLTATMILVGATCGLMLGAAVWVLPGVSFLMPENGHVATVAGGIALGAAWALALVVIVIGPRPCGSEPVLRNWPHALRIAGGLFVYGVYLALVSLMAAQTGRLLPPGGVFFASIVLMVLANIPLASIVGP